MRTEGRADMTKLIAAFRNYANASKKNIPTAKVLWYNEARHMAHETNNSNKTEHRDTRP